MSHKNDSGLDPSHPRSPRSADEQDAPEPERLTTPQEEAGQDIAGLDDPPQAEGDRESADD
jgi:hypothetical protein